MDVRELAQLTGQIIDRVAPRLEVRPTAARDAASVRGACHAGEWQIELEYLVTVLLDERIPVTADDHSALKALFEVFSASRSEEARCRAQSALTDLAKVLVVSGP